MDFEEWSIEDNENDSDVKERQLVEKKCENQSVGHILYVRDFSVKQLDDSLCFSSHSEIGCFRIDGNQSYRDSNVEPNLLQLWDSVCKRKTNLSNGFEESKLITDYRSYKQLKWKYFLTWINKSQLLMNRSPEVMPHFISFGGLFTSLMMTPFKIESWALLVCKHRNCIFMNKIRLNERNELNCNNYVNRGLVDRGPYYASKLTSLITKQNHQSIDSPLNEFDKYFAVYESQFGEHRLLLMNEFDAVDEEGNRYEIKCVKNVKYRQKLLNWWSHCVVADIDYILIGLRDNNDIINDIVKLETLEVPDMEEFHWNPSQSYHFVNRILNYINQLFKDANDGVIYKVSYRKGDKLIRNTKLMTNNLLPDWFLEGKCGENVAQFVY